MELTVFSFLLYFLPVMLVVYFLLRSLKKVRNIWLILCGLVFYLMNGVAYAVLPIAIALLNHWMGYELSRAVAITSAENDESDKVAIGKAKKVARVIVVISIIINLAPLVAFSYLPKLLGQSPLFFDFEQWPSFMVPFLLAVLALQGISYIVDIFREKAQYNSDIISTLVYFTFFPVAFAGPIIKYHEMATQIEDREITFSKISSGICRLVVGLAKLCVIATPLLAVATIVIEQSNLSGVYTNVPISLILLGLFTSLIGMYHFLSGFSDLSIGIGKILGFTFPENFRHPQLATTMAAFWQRCFSSLTGWFDEYVYDSLSKKRSNNDRMVLHMLLMWILIGLWTGPSIPHIIFGFWNFLFLLFEKVVEMKEKRNKTIFRNIYIFIVAIVSVIALNTSSLYQFTLFISNLFGMKGYGFYSEFALSLLIECWPILLAGLITAFPIATKLRECAGNKTGFVGGAYTVFYTLAMIVLVVLVVLSLSGVSYDPTQIFSTFFWRS